MSITPRKPPNSVNAGASEPTGAESASTRFAYRFWRGLKAVAGWLRGTGRSLLTRDAGDRPTGERDAAHGSRLRLGPVARLTGDADAETSPMRRELPGHAEPRSPELTPRPDLEAEETDDGLVLSRPDSEDAYVSSDHWQEVRR